MAKRHNVMMETCKFIVILISYCVCVSSGYPSRPLNERSPDLTWQAWLLVDDQNQNKQQTNADGVLRRRITPKSVFIAPTFSPESLPACAEGYSSDPMGRCIKIIKLDQDAHYEFLIEKLKEKFSQMDYEDEEEEELTTPGPFQVNIPLSAGYYGKDEDGYEGTDVAIIVTPTMPNFDMKTLNLGKRDSVYEENTQELLLKKLAETTTSKPDETTVTTLVTELPSTTLNNEKTDQFVEADDLTTITDPNLTTEDDSTSTITTSEYVKRSTTTELDSTTQTSDTSTADSITTSTTDSILTASTETTATTRTSEVVTSLPILIRFPEEPAANPRVRFPDGGVSVPTQIPSSVEHIANARDSHRSDSVVFRDQPLEIANADYSNGAASTATRPNFNRRNRDRHNGLFLLPPNWSPSTFQKPVVLRFSRKHAYFDMDQFKHPDYYRSIPSDDLAYLFKFKHKQSSRR